jgi:hypothetical protein
LSKGAKHEDITAKHMFEILHKPIHSPFDKLRVRFEDAVLPSALRKTYRLNIELDFDKPEFFSVGPGSRAKTLAWDDKFFSCARPLSGRPLRGEIRE